MEIKSAIEHNVVSRFENNYLECIKSPKERMKRLIFLYKDAVLSLEKLKSERDNKKISDTDFFHQYFPLFNLNIASVEAFSKLILGENVNQILIQKQEIEEEIDEVPDYGSTTYKNLQIWYNAFSNELSGNPILKHNDILHLTKERKLFLFGSPIREVVTKTADIKFSHNNTNIYTLRNDKNNGGYLFKSYDLKYFDRIYGDIVELLRHSLSDEDIESAKDKLRDMDFSILEEDFKLSKEDYLQKAVYYGKLEKDAMYYKNLKSLAKRP